MTTIKILILSSILMFSCMNQQANRVPSSDSTEQTDYTVSANKIIDNIMSTKNLGMNEFLQSSDGSKYREDMLEMQRKSHELFEAANDWFNHLPSEEQKVLLKRLLKK